MSPILLRTKQPKPHPLPSSIRAASFILPLNRSQRRLLNLCNQLTTTERPSKYNHTMIPAKCTPPPNYTIIERLGSIAHTTVYTLADCKRRRYIGKMRPKSTGYNELLNEVDILDRLRKRSFCVPRRLFSGCISGSHWLVTNPPWKSVYEWVEETGRPLNLSTVLMIGIRALKALEKLHYVGVLHRDITPHSMTLQRNERSCDIQFKDFFYSTVYRHSNRVHIHPHREYQHRGNVAYCSRRVQGGVTPARRDDVQSLIYTLLYLSRRGLTWIREKNHEKMMVMKDDLSKGGAFSGVPKALKWCFVKCRELEFAERPDYQGMRRGLEGALEEYGWGQGWIW